MGGIGIVCDEFIPIGTKLVIEIDLSRLAKGNLSESALLNAKVVGNYDMGYEKLNGMEFQLTRDSYHQLREANNYLTSKMSSEEIYAILEESGVSKDDVL